MENKDCCDDCRGSNATLNESGTSIVWYCTNSSCPCHSKTPEKDETIIPNREKQPLPKPNKLDKIFSIEAPTDESWRKDYYLQFGDTDFRKENPYTYDAVAEFIASLLQKELAEEKKGWEEADKNTYMEAYELGKSEAFRLVKGIVESKISAYNYQSHNESLEDILTKLSTLEGK